MQQGVWGPEGGSSKAVDLLFSQQNKSHSLNYACRNMVSVLETSYFEKEKKRTAAHLKKKKSCCSLERIFSVREPSYQESGTDWTVDDVE